MSENAVSGFSALDLNPRERFALARMIAVLDCYLGTPDPRIRCCCGHSSNEHRHGTDTCGGVGAAGLRCTCPGLFPDDL